MTNNALLALEDGTLFHGVSVGADGFSAGEVVFNTSMTGYQEILTDPSYARQIITLTYPHIGNVGVNVEDVESGSIYASGLVVRDVPVFASNWRCQRSLKDFLETHEIVAISGIDTRKLTKLLRDKGAQNGCIMAGETLDEARALAEARSFPGLQGMDLAKRVTSDKPYPWTQGTWGLTEGFADAAHSERHLVAYDFGIKRNILRIFAERGFRLTVVPATMTAEQVFELRPDAVFLSNGPGDPEPCDYAIDAIKKILGAGIPTFGICLGHQLLALASGARTIKMKFGHHGANHPVQELATGRVLVSSQNHGFVVDEASLPDELVVTHRSLFDGSLQGIQRTDCPALGFQGHPEASPGPHDVHSLFDTFIEMIDQRH